MVDVRNAYDHLQKKLVIDCGGDNVVLDEPVLLDEAQAFVMGNLVYGIRKSLVIHRVHVHYFFTDLVYIGIATEVRVWLIHLFKILFVVMA